MPRQITASSANKAAPSRGPGLLDPKAALIAGEAILPWMIEIRRDLHQHPELGLEEFRTAAQVQARLDEIGIEHVDGIGGTGVVGTLPGPCRTVVGTVRTLDPAIQVLNALTVLTR